MKYYLMSRKLRENSTLLDQVSHELIEFSTGHFLPKDFKGPLVVSLDEEFIDGKMATIYMDPAVIVKKEFYQKLINLGVDNIEMHPVVIQDNIRNVHINNYVLMNIIGRISCADMNRSKYSDLGDGMNVIDKLVIDSTKADAQEFFLAHEDTDCIIIGERIHRELQKMNYPDVYFECLETV